MERGDPKLGEREGRNSLNESELAATATTATTLTSFAYTHELAENSGSNLASSSFQVQSEGMRVLDRDLSAKESKDVRVRVKLLLDR